MNKKQKLGQYFTTNYKYILSNMKIPDNIITIIEPFVGNEIYYYLIHFFII
jgi:hypothetical protein